MDIKLDNTDVYLLDLGTKLIQWNGCRSNKDERQKALAYRLKRIDDRGGKARHEVLDDIDGVDDSDVRTKF